MKWLQITVTTTHECAELVADILGEAGSDGVSIKDFSDIRELIASGKNWDYADESLLKAADDPRVLVCGFFPENFDCASVTAELELFRTRATAATGSLETSFTLLDSADWENEWRKYYSPIAIGGVVIVPAWCKAPDDGRIPVFIEPGMAFGTGSHETTSACVELMQHVPIAGKRVIDVGCGSGILGVTAAKLGAASVRLSDIDPQAVTAAERNIALNGVESVCDLACGDLDLGGGADVAIANITADVLVRLVEPLSGVLESGGYAILSGIINQRADDVLAAYREKFELAERLQRGEWQAFLMKKL